MVWAVTLILSTGLLIDVPLWKGGLVTIRGWRRNEAVEEEEEEEKEEEEEEEEEKEEEEEEEEEEGREKH
ncbi:hypothetical protein KCU83_g2693, partial [Aureobasidium melanogenum]